MLTLEAENPFCVFLTFMNLLDMKKMGKIWNSLFSKMKRVITSCPEGTIWLTKRKVGEAHLSSYPQVMPRAM
jgi:hypothetical protein